MKKIAPILLTIFMSIFGKAENLIDIDFTTDIAYWESKFPAMSWNAENTDYFVGNLNGYAIDGFSFKGAFGKFNPGAGNYGQPIDIEDKCIQHIYSFRVANTGTSYIEFPQVSSAGLLTIHCKSGNVKENAVFAIQKLVNGKWEHVRTMIAPPHGNTGFDVVLRQNLDISSPVKLRIYGATKNLHVYAMSLEKHNPELAKNKPLRLIVMPDTQNYTKSYPEIFISQTTWIANNADSISFVLHVGDITNANNANQWPTAVNAMSLMDDVPYTFVTGNHDVGTNGSSDTRNTSMINKYLPYSKYSERPHFGGVYEANKMDNSWHEFTASNGYKFLILSLEWAPREKALEWAGNIIETHPEHNVIINTHGYLYSDDRRLSDMHGHNWTPGKYGLYAASQGDANDGEQIWDKLVKLYPNVLMVVCGHVLNDGTGFLVSEGIAGNKVYQMLANYQTGVTGSENGGNGYLRIIDIDVESEAFHVRTYSPYLNDYKIEDDHEFSCNEVKFIAPNPSRHLDILKKEGFNALVSKNCLHIQNYAENDFSVSIFDLMGKSVFAKKKVLNNLSIPLQKGFFIVCLDTGEKIVSQKIIVR